MKEMKELEDRGVPVRERLRLSEACPLILPYHIALDNAREKLVVPKRLGQQVVVLVLLMKIKLHVVVCALVIYSIKQRLQKN